MRDVTPPVMVGAERRALTSQAMSLPTCSIGAASAAGEHLGANRASRSQQHQ